MGVAEAGTERVIVTFVMLAGLVKVETVKLETVIVYTVRQQQEEEEQVGQKNPVKMTVAVTSQEGPEIAAVYSQVEKMAASLTISRKV